MYLIISVVTIRLIYYSLIGNDLFERKTYEMQLMLYIVSTRIPDCHMAFIQALLE